MEITENREFDSEINHFTTIDGGVRKSGVSEFFRKKSEYKD